MSKNQRETEIVEVKAAEPQSVNRVMKFFRYATIADEKRSGFMIEGHPGCLVVHRNLFADGKGPGPGDVLTLSWDLVQPKAKVTSAEKDAAKAAKVIERTAKAQARVEAQALKAQATKEKAEAILAKAKATVEAATGSGAQV